MKETEGDRRRYVASRGEDKRQHFDVGRANVLYLLLSSFIFFYLLSPLKVSAQISGTNSTYSRFGLGLPVEQSNGLNKSMGGAGIGVRIGNRINSTNPASYSAIDSLSLIFDVGMTGSFGKMKQGSIQVGTNNASLDYVHAGMHVGKKLGLALGVMPYTTIGYDFSSPEQPVGSDHNTTQSITTTTYYRGSGGLNQAYIGLGWRVFRNISIGANVSFLWGQYEHRISPLFLEGGYDNDKYSSVPKVMNASLKTYKLDFGMQYPIRLTKQDWLNLGATAALGHKIPQDVTLVVGSDTTATASSPFDLPYSFGFGAAWQHKNTFLVAADVRHEFWSNCRVPAETLDDYVPTKGFYKDMTKIALGAQWTPDPLVKSYWKRIQYRAGMNFSTPFLKINDRNGPVEFRMGAGVGLPITNKINNRSVVNVGLQWMRRSASGNGMVKEDYLLINLGMTFNERWFVKYKIE